jgi:hypothetical protein
MPVRSLTQSLLRWPEPEQILNQVRLWAAHHPGLERVGLAPGGAAAQLRCPGAHAHRTRRTAGQRLGLATALQRDSRWLCGGAARFGAFVAAGAD